jgi:hypothetical protein
MLFKDIIDDCYLRDYLENNKREYHGIHLSELDCLRSYMLKVLGYTKATPTPEDIRVFDFGSMMHERFQDLLLRYGYISKDAIERSVVSDIYPLDSSADVAPIIIDNEEWVLDFKSMKDTPPKSFTCKGCKTKGRTKPSEFDFSGISKPLEKHRKQIMLYMYFLNIPRGKLIYVSKNGGIWTPNGRQSDIKEFDVMLDELEVRLYLKDVEKLSALIQEKKLPPIPSDAESFYCRYFCGLQGVCTTLL